jgi:plasmid maintenance system antidote protein VapI
MEAPDDIDKLTAAMIEVRLPQAEMARRAGMSRQNLNAILKRKTGVSLVMIARLEKVIRERRAEVEG